MKSLIAVLKHPCLVVNRVAEGVYGEKGAKYNERLRSRIKERHYFTFHEYQQLRKVLMAFSMRLDQIAEGMTEALSTSTSKPDWKKLMRNRWIKSMVILRKVGKPYGLTELQVYDRLRGRGILPDTFLPNLIQEYREFASWIREKLAEAKIEKKTYEFSQGTGGAGHRRKTSVE